MHLALAVLAASWMLLSSTAALAQSRAPVPVGWRSDSLRIADTWNTFTADMKVSRQHVRANGQVIGALVPAASYRLERSNRSGTWKTVTTVVSIAQSPQTTLAATTVAPGPLPVGRIEDDEDGTQVRAYDAQGARIRDFRASAPASTAATSNQPRSTDRTWINTMVATTAQKAQRMQAFERRFGPSPSTSNRKVFTRQTGDVVQQLIADSNYGVPMEYSETRAGLRTVRQTFTYGFAPDGLVRLASRAELRQSADIDDLLVVETTYSNIRLERR